MKIISKNRRGQSRVLISKIKNSVMGIQVGRFNKQRRETNLGSCFEIVLTREQIEALLNELDESLACVT